MDLGIEMVSDTPGTVTVPSGLSPWETRVLPHPFVAMEVTDKGIEKLCEYVAAVREAVGMEIPLAMDHLGHLGVNSIIRLGKAYEKYNLAWMEDVIPWQYTGMLKHITDESPTPICTGEDIYLKEGFINLCEKHAISKIHPDLSTSGGILETHKIGDAAMEYGVPMMMHYAGLPINCMASVHCAAATENFLALENHWLDVPWWQDLVEGPDKPIINKGCIAVPDKPGLGITLNEDMVKRHLAPGAGYFEPTSRWDNERALRRPSLEHGSAAYGGQNGRGIKRALKTEPREPSRAAGRKRPSRLAPRGLPEPGDPAAPGPANARQGPFAGTTPSSGAPVPAWRRDLYRGADAHRIGPRTPPTGAGPG